MANGTYHRETGRHCESLREKGPKMFQALIPHPLSPEVNVGDIILFFVVCVAFLVAATKSNGR